MEKILLNFLTWTIPTIISFLSFIMLINSFNYTKFKPICIIICLLIPLFLHGWHKIINEIEEKNK